MSPAWLGFPWEHGRGQVANKLSQRPEPVSNPSFASEATLIDLEAANRRVSALAQLSATLSEAVTKEQAIAAVVAGAEEVSGATRAAFVAIDGGRLDLVREEGLSPLLVDYVQQVGVPDESPVAFAARTGETVLLGSPDEIEERFPNSAPLAEATGLLAIANLPIRLGGRVVGVLHVGFDSPHEFTRGEREYLLALASLCAHAVERAEVFDWQSRITRSLMQAETPGQVADLASAEIRTLFGADRIALHMIDPVSGDLVATGHPLGQVRPRRVLGARSSPTSEAVWSRSSSVPMVCRCPHFHCP
jgi:transcriptional regulator with GAF, ATPase, and Fis domain